MRRSKTSQNDPTRGVREGTGIFLSQVLSDFGCELLPQMSTPQRFSASVVLEVLRQRSSDGDWKSSGAQ